MKTKLTKENTEFLNSLSMQVSDGENKWHYCPFWFKELGNNTYEIVTFEKLPINIIEIINSSREVDATKSSK